MRREKSQQDWERDRQARAANKSIYRNDFDIVQSEAIRCVRSGDLTGAERGVFYAGLAACALGAESAAEALPFLRQLARETGEPGWSLAGSAIEADSAVFLEALVELGMLDLLDEKVSRGYKDQNGEFCRDRVCTLEAVAAGSARCVSFLLDRVPSDGLLAAAVAARYPDVFNILLHQAIESRDESSINEALKALSSSPNDRFDSVKLSSEQMGARLTEAGASLSYAAGSPPSHSSWNGSSPSKMEEAWVPALLLAEPAETPPLGASGGGAYRGADFFSQWSSACLLVRSAIEGGYGEGGQRLLALLSDWEFAAAPESPLTPLALMAMTNPATTDSRLRRTTLDTAAIILGSPRLDEALEDSGPLSLIRAAVGKWLWGSSATPPKPQEKTSWYLGVFAPDPLVEGLSERCATLGIRPLGASGALVAAQEALGKLYLWKDEAYRSSGASPYEGVEQFAERRQKEEQAYDQRVDKERQAAEQLASLMPEAFAERFISAVKTAHARRKEPNSDERMAFKESLILGLISAEPGLANRPRL